jgi:hypothetical protein
MMYPFLKNHRQDVLTSTRKITARKHGRDQFQREAEEDWAK